MPRPLSRGKTHHLRPQRRLKPMTGAPPGQPNPHLPHSSSAGTEKLNLSRPRSSAISAPEPPARISSGILGNEPSSAPEGITMRRIQVHVQALEQPRRAEQRRPAPARCAGRAPPGPPHATSNSRDIPGARGSSSWSRPWPAARARAGGLVIAPRRRPLLFSLDGLPAAWPRSAFAAPGPGLRVFSGVHGGAARRLLRGGCSGA